MLTELSVSIVFSDSKDVTRWTWTKVQRLPYLSFRNKCYGTSSFMNHIINQCTLCRVRTGSSLLTWRGLHKKHGDGHHLSHDCSGSFRLCHFRYIHFFLVNESYSVFNSQKDNFFSPLKSFHWSSLFHRMLLQFQTFQWNSKKECPQNRIHVVILLRLCEALVIKPEINADLNPWWPSALCQILQSVNVATARKSAVSST